MKFMVKAWISLLLMGITHLVYAGSGALFNVTTGSNSLAIKTTIPNRSYPRAGIKIRTSNYTLAGVGTECTLLQNGYCVFSVNNSVTSNISLSGSGGTLDITLCLNGNGPLSCQEYNNLSVSTPPTIAKYLYVTNYDNSAPVKVCTLDANGDVSSCVNTGIGDINIPAVGIALNSESTKAYISVDSTNNIFQCDINSTNGTFSSCVQTTMANTDYSTGGYGSLIANQTNSFAYLVDDGSNGFSNNLLICPISSGTISSTCSAPVVLSNSGAGEGITITQSGETVYVADYSDHGVYVCGTTSGGSSINSCVLKTGDGTITFGSIAGVALNPAETLIYITAYNSGNVYACTTTPNGTSNFDHCFIAGSGMSNVAGLTINAAGTKAYLGSFVGDLFACTIKTDGSFELPCSLTSGFTSSMSVALGY